MNQASNSLKPIVGIIGLSHLGLVTAIGIASKGFSVIAFDSDSALIEKLNRNDLPISEPGLPELIATVKKTIKFTFEKYDVRACDVLYVAKDVPTSDANVSDTTVISKLLEEIVLEVKDKASLVIHSQVSPGFSRKILKIVKAQDRGIRLFYQVETLVFGSAVSRVLNPERYIVGCEDPSLPLPTSYEAVLGAFACPQFCMRYESAELAKISINMFLVSSVITSSTLAELSEEIGADWSEIVPTLRLDKRIGPHAYLSPGLGIAGGNLERDLVSVQTMAAENGTDSGIVASWIKHSQYRSKWVLKEISRNVFSKNKEANIAVWGLAYKADTHSIKNSAGIALVDALKLHSLRVYDPKVELGERAQNSVVQVRDPIDACVGTDALALMTPWAEFSKIDPKSVASAMRGRDIFDPYGALDAANFRAHGFTIYTLGKK